MSSKEASRKYPQKDVKVLFGLAAGRCSFPDCPNICIAKETEKDPAVTIGKLIAHIEAHSNKGPRANPNLTPKERDCYKNWILLCSHHHDQVDVQPNSYTVEELRKWKEDHEKWVFESLESAIPQINSAELEMLTQGLLADVPNNFQEDYRIIPPLEKMKKNNLTDRVARELRMGVAGSKEVEGFINQISKLIPSYPEKLKTSFVKAYIRLKEEGFFGDSLFYALCEYARQGNLDFRRQAAALCIVGYFFEACEVFEK